MRLTGDGCPGSIWSEQPWTGMRNTASSVNGCHQSPGVAMASDSHTHTHTHQPQAPGVVSRTGLHLKYRPISHARANIILPHVYNAVCITGQMKSALSQTGGENGSDFDLDACSGADLFRPRLLLCRGVEEECQVSGRVMALHCLLWRSQMKCVASSPVSGQRRAELWGH